MEHPDWLGDFSKKDLIENVGSDTNPVWLAK